MTTTIHNGKKIITQKRWTSVPAGPSLGQYPLWLARLIVWLLKRNKWCFVELELKGRKPKKGFKYNWGGSLKLKNARAATIYVRGAKRRVRRTFIVSQEPIIQPTSIERVIP